MYHRKTAHRAPEPAKQAPPRVYTIVKTGIDTDRGFFPEPLCEGSYLSPTQARLEFERLAAAEREKLDDRYDGKECDENH